MERWDGWRSDGPRAPDLVALFFGGCSQTPRIRVGSKNFSEQLVLGEIVAQHLENRLHGHVSRKLDLGGTLLAQQAIESGEIDVFPEYTGTALTAVLKQQPEKDPAKVLDESARVIGNGIWNGWTHWASRTLSLWPCAGKMPMAERFRWRRRPAPGGWGRATNLLTVPMDCRDCSRSTGCA